MQTSEPIDLPDNDAQQLWFSFKDAFNATCKEATLLGKRIIWGNSERTAFYRNEIMPAVAQRLGLEPGKEEFKVDYVMSKKGRNFSYIEEANWDYNETRWPPDLPKRPMIPVVFIKSENDIARATHEIRKLCSLNSPLRVLITMTPDDWINMESINKQLHIWQTIIQDHANSNFLYGGVIGIIIGSLAKDEGKVRYKTCCFGRDDHFLQQPQLLEEGLLVVQK